MLAFPINDSAWMKVEFVPLELRPCRAAGIGYARVAGARAVNERLNCVRAPPPVTSICPDAVIVASSAIDST